MTEYILPFDSNEVSLSRAGGKGMNLARLVQAGFEAPDGFIITTHAYRNFVEANGLQSRLLSLAGSISPDDPASLEAASAGILSLFLNGAMPAEISSAVRAAYRELSAGSPVVVPVAVRSSATTEDLPGLAFAGQQDTYLNITGDEAVLEAVKRCWASLWTARAMAYRRRAQIPPEQAALAVVVQQMIFAEVSGVLFTANPVTGRRDEIVIEASFGLGEAIVSGQVEADRYLVDPHHWQILERRLGAKQVAVVPRPEGGTQRVDRAAQRAGPAAQGIERAAAGSDRAGLRVDHANQSLDHPGPGIGRDASQAALDDGQVIELAQLGRRVAEHFGSPQDIEWAWAEGRFSLLQARPITSLYPLPVLPERPDRLRVYINFNAIQGVPGPLTPLGIDALRLLVGGIFKSLQIHSPATEILPEAGDRLFLEVTALAEDPRLRKLLFNLLSQADPVALPAVHALIDESRIPPRRVLTPVRLLSLLSGVLPVLFQVARSILFPNGVYERTIAQAESYLQQVRRHASSAVDLAERLRAMEQDLSQAERGISSSAVPTAMFVSGLVPTLDRWLVKWLGEEPGAAFKLLRALPDNVTTHMNLKLWASAQAIRSDPASREGMLLLPAESLAKEHRRGQLPAAAQKAVDDFLQEYGMRSVAEIDLGQPRWREDPLPVLQSLLGYLRLEEPDRAPDVVFRGNQEQAGQLAAGLIARARKTRLGWLRAWLLEAVIRRMRKLGGLREVPLFYMVKTLDVYRQALLDSGRQLASSGRQLASGGELLQAVDLFYIPLDELKRFARGEAVNLKETAASGRAKYENELARKQAPHVLLSDGEAFYAGMKLAAEDDCDLAGEPVSPGLVEGRVRVVLDPRGIQLEPGEILVCPATDPGWTPLFLTAGGLVMEIGGMVTHGSVVAREYGLPAVVGVQNATTRLKTGERVQVDGSQGCVRVMA